MATDGLQFARGGARYTGVELTPTGIEMAQERFELYGETGHFQVANAEELPLPDSSFDHVYSFGVLMHLRTRSGLSTRSIACCGPEAR